jgi:hypothetical protein
MAFGRNGLGEGGKKYNPESDFYLDRALEMRYKAIIPRKTQSNFGG